MTLLVHLSDTHFGTEVADVVRAVENAVLTIKPDIVTITGDITQRATPNQFKAAKKFLNALPADLKFVIPGNHDIPLFNIPQRLFDPYRHYTKVFGLREGVWCHDRIGIIGYNATSRWRHTRGKLLEDDVLSHIQQARKLLQPGAILVACAHQPLVVGLPQDQENVLVNANHVAKIFSENGVDLVLSGHVHWPLVTTTVKAFPNLPRPFILSGAGTAISRRTRPGAPNSFNVINIQAETAEKQVSITSMDYDETTKVFTSSVEKIFSLSSIGWTIKQTIQHVTRDGNTIPNYASPHY